MKTMETKENQNQVIITLNSDDKKQKLPINLLITLAAGTFAGMAIIFGLFWGFERIMGL